MNPDEVVTEFRRMVREARELLYQMQQLCREYGYPLLVARHHVDQLGHHLDDAEAAVREMQQVERSSGA